MDRRPDRPRSRRAKWVGYGACTHHYGSGDPLEDPVPTSVPPPEERQTPAPIESLGHRLRKLVGLSVDEPVPLPEPAPTPPREIEFIGYAEDCVLLGHIRMEAPRLSDLLNHHDEFELVDVQAAGLDGDSVFEVKHVVVGRDELLIVHAVGPRGERGRRMRTRQHPLAMQIGPYQVRGYLHALPGADPISSIRRRQQMVPLTDAWIEYDQNGVHQRRRVETLIVNRHQLDWVVEAEDEQVEMPDLPLNTEKGPLVKDFTGHVLGGTALNRRG